MLTVIWIAFLVACAVTSVVLIVISMFYARTVFVPRAEIMEKLEDPAQRDWMLKELERTLGTVVRFDAEYPDPDPKRKDPIRVVIAAGNVLGKVREMFLYSPIQAYPYPWIE